MRLLHMPQLLLMLLLQPAAISVPFAGCRGASSLRLPQPQLQLLDLHNNLVYSAEAECVLILHQDFCRF